MNNPAKRVRQLLDILQKYTDEVESSLDDNEKKTYEELLRQRRSDIQIYTRRLDTAQAQGDSGLAEITKIHSELLNRYFS
ncbi:MAG: hypothetical protein Q8K98_08720 [Bacteroidota bacterium]|nr:hypothetical protein [Bacteroidota bacterium]